MAPKKRVAIIGAGFSGIASIKSCLEEGLEPVCFEQFDTFGGVWHYTENYREGQGARAFENLASNVCKDMLCFSDFPFPDDYPPFVSCQMVCDYIQSYCDKFGLMKYIHFNTTIKNIKKARDYDVTGRLDVEKEDANGIQTDVFDFVMVCSGFYKKARYPDVDGMDTFKGSVAHGQTFKNGQPYTGQTVLVVGNSHSAMDMSSIISQSADQVYCAVGRGLWVLPKFGKMGAPWDILVHRRVNFWNLKKLDRLIADIASNRLNQFHAGVFPATPPTQSRVAIGDAFPLSIMTGKVKVMGHLTRLGSRHAEFADGTVINNLDAILFCTGYDLSLDFLAERVKGDKGQLFLYKMMFPLQLPHNTLSMIGFVDSDGAIPPVAEIQSRLAARVFSGAHKLPSKQSMTEDVNRWNDFLFGCHGRYKYLMPNTIFRDEIAAELGVIPSWWDLIKAGPRLAYLFYYGPAYPFYFRLWGPHPWSGARKAIDNALECGNYAKQPRVDPKRKEGGRGKSSLLLWLAVGGLAACLAVHFSNWYNMSEIS